MDAQAAKSKWCPFAFVRDAGVPAAVNRLSNRDDECNCIGPRCMCWRTLGNNQGWCGLAGDKGAQ
jgi:hypothetical protein